MRLAVRYQQYAHGNIVHLYRFTGRVSFRTLPKRMLKSMLDRAVDPFTSSGSRSGC